MLPRDAIVREVFFQPTDVDIVKHSEIPLPELDLGDATARTLLRRAPLLIAQPLIFQAQNGDRGEPKEGCQQGSRHAALARREASDVHARTAC